MKLLSIVGARPQFVKLGVICRAVADRRDTITHRIIHTGQHYDTNMSEVFFRELEIPHPDYELEIGSGSHGVQTGAMLSAIEDVLKSNTPDWVIVYGDTNSTLAGALAAAKLNIQIAHVEAGLRSHNRRMPEEINRVVADHLSTLLLCPSDMAMKNLASEGLQARAVWTGDVMFDAVLHALAAAETMGLPHVPQNLLETKFGLATIHRAENTDDKDRLTAIVRALDRIARDVCPVYFAIHPRTRKAMVDAGCEPNHVVMGEPLPYLAMLKMLGQSRFVLTDSGGIQKEAYFLRVPCITLRNETEWTETLHNRCNVLAGPSEDAILEAIGGLDDAGPWETLYGDGRAGPAVIDTLQAWTPSSKVS